MVNLGAYLRGLWGSTGPVWPKLLTQGCWTPAPCLQHHPQTSSIWFQSVSDGSTRCPCCPCTGSYATRIAYMPDMSDNLCLTSMQSSRELCCMHEPCKATLSACIVAAMHCPCCRIYHPEHAYERHAKALQSNISSAHGLPLLSCIVTTVLRHCSACTLVLSCAVCQEPCKTAFLCMYGLRLVSMHCHCGPHVHPHNFVMSCAPCTSHGSACTKPCWLQSHPGG